MDELESLCTYTEHGSQCDNRWTLNFGRKLCSYHNAVLNGRAVPGPAPRKVPYVNWWMARQMLNSCGEAETAKAFGYHVVNRLLDNPLAGSPDVTYLEVRYGVRA